MVSVGAHPASVSNATRSWREPGNRVTCQSLGLLTVVRDSRRSHPNGSRNRYHGRPEGEDPRTRPSTRRCREGVWRRRRAHASQGRRDHRWRRFRFCQPAHSVSTSGSGRRLPTWPVSSSLRTESSGKTTLTLHAIANVQKQGGVSAFSLTPSMPSTLLMRASSASGSFFF